MSRTDSLGDVVGTGISGTSNIIGSNIVVTNPVLTIFDNISKGSSAFTRKGSTTFLTIQRFNENFSITAAHFTDEHPFSPVFPTSFLYVDEKPVKKEIINEFSKILTEKVKPTLINDYKI